jgi:P4 family phage/plasmid primase-like protien
MSFAGGEYRFHRALWLGGEGRNGKSTFIDVLKALIGPGNYSVLSIKSLVGDKFAAADLDGKIANFSEETSTHELSDSGPFKNLTGDGDIRAEKKYGDPYFFRNKAKLIMTYNQIPDLSDLSKGMLSRPLIIPFEKIIDDKEQDRNIKQKLLSELPGIFNFALKGWKRLEKRDSFSFSAKSIIALETRIIFYDEEFNAPKGIRSYSPFELYDIYSSHERYPFKFISFCRRLNKHPKMRAIKSRDKRSILYENLGFKTRL